MCRCCKDITNIQQRIANHDFMEQMREFYGLEEKHLKDRRRKNIKKSVVAKIEHQIRQMQQKTQYNDYAVRLSALLETPFNEAITPQAFDAIMDEFYQIQRAEIFAYFKSEG